MICIPIPPMPAASTLVAFAIGAFVGWALVRIVDRLPTGDIGWHGDGEDD